MIEGHISYYAHLYLTNYLAAGYRSTIYAMAIFAVFLIITPIKHGWDIIWGLFQPSFASGKWMGEGG